MGLERYKSMNVSRANEMNKNKRRHSQTLCQGKRQKAARFTTPFERNPGVETQVSYTAQGHTQKESNVLESKEYEYNAAERLIRYASTEQGQSGPQIEASYRHDPFGRRIAKTVKQGSQTKTTYYIYSEQGLMAEADEKGQMTKAYGFNPTTMQLGLWSTDPIWQAETPNGSLTDPKARYDWLHTDHLGTPILATTKEGQTSWKAIAESFGSTQIIEQDIEVNLRFPGQYFDAETGTYYNFHRDYRPNAGRYLQSDPIGLEGGVNVYGYVNLHPLNNVDFLGLYGGLDIPGAYFYYCYGSGEPWNVDFSSINWGNLNNQINSRLIALAGTSCKTSKMPVNLLIPAQTEGCDRYIIGRHSIRVTGILEISCDCTWKFNGIKKSDSGVDIYNMNKSDRGKVAESLTTGGRWFGILCGSTPFGININGFAFVKTHGLILGENTCGCEK